MEPNGLLRIDGKRPDGLSLIPWKTGKFVLWIFTVVNTLTISNIKHSSQNTDAAAEAASFRKV